MGEIPAILQSTPHRPYTRTPPSSRELCKHEENGNDEWSSAQASSSMWSRPWYSAVRRVNFKNLLLSHTTGSIAYWTVRVSGAVSGG